MNNFSDFFEKTEQITKIYTIQIDARNAFKGMLRSIKESEKCPLSIEYERDKVSITTLPQIHDQIMRTWTV